MEHPGVRERPPSPEAEHLEPVREAMNGVKAVVVGSSSRQGERRLNRVRIDIKRLPWENWHDIYNEVILPLAHEGADVFCQVIVIAKGDAAIRENTIELGIKESLSQREIQADIQTG